MESLDLLANNIANANTAGFRRDGEFYSLYKGDINSNDARQDPDLLALPLIDRNWIDFTEGSVTETGKPLDVALSGKGFFAVETPSGPSYTRNGSFQLGPNGELQTREGYALATVDNKPILLERTEPVTIHGDGRVEQSARVVGQLRLVDFDPEAPLAKLGNNYLKLTDTQAVVRAANQATLRQGSLETSNVAPAEATTRLIAVMRQFEMLQRAVTLGSEMNRKASEEVARVSA